jgi:hypothetical protein
MYTRFSRTQRGGLTTSVYACYVAYVTIFSRSERTSLSLVLSKYELFSGLSVRLLLRSQHRILLSPDCLENVGRLARPLTIYQIILCF